MATGTPNRDKTHAHPHLSTSFPLWRRSRHESTLGSSMALVRAGEVGESGTQGTLSRTRDVSGSRGGSYPTAPCVFPQEGHQLWLSAGAGAWANPGSPLTPVPGAPAGFLPGSLQRPLRWACVILRGHGGSEGPNHTSRVAHGVSGCTALTGPSTLPSAAPQPARSGNSDAQAAS